MLRNAIIFAVECVAENVVTAIIFKSAAYYFPCVSAVMVKQAFHILKDEHFGLTFFYDTCKFSKQCAARVSETFTLAYHGECLARGAAYKEIDFIKVRCSIESMNVAMPPVSRNVVVREIRLSTFLVYITGKYNFEIQSETLKSVLYCAYTTERCS